MTRHTSACILAALALLPIAGCVPTLARHDAGSPSASTEAITPAGRQLDEDALRDALPKPRDLGAAWNKDTSGGATADSATVGDFEPQRCARLSAVGPQWDSMEVLEHGSSDLDYVRTRDAGSSSSDYLGLSVTSYTTPYPDALLDLKAEALDDCQNFKVRDTGGIWDDYTQEDLSFPALGDHTVAFRVVARIPLGDDVIVATTDSVTVKVGHNLVHAQYTSLDGIPEAGITESAVRQSIAGLEEQP